MYLLVIMCSDLVAISEKYENTINEPNKKFKSLIEYIDIMEELSENF